MADYITRKHTVLLSDESTTYPAGTVFAGATLNGDKTLEQLNLFLIDANGKRSGTPINIEPNTLIAGLSEV